MQSDDSNIIIVEPFYGGSHKQLIETVFDKESGIAAGGTHHVFTYTLPAKKWHWRARTSALHFAQTITPVDKTCTLFASSVLNLAELSALRPDLARCRKILYFHENQLEYPVQEEKQRDFQYGYNQILSCLVADVVLFNSNYNLTSFLHTIPSFLKSIPDGRPDGVKVVDQLRAKCQVLYFPMQLPPSIGSTRGHVLHIVWPHRWEHDKDPETFFEVLEDLKSNDLDFRVSVLGEMYRDNPGIFERMKSVLQGNIVHWGYQESKERYYHILSQSHVVVSTAKHEFFGVAMLEAVHLGCYPLAPNRLVYPELYPEECLYNTKAQLAKKLRYFCRYPEKSRYLQVDINKYSWTLLKSQYEQLLIG